MTTYSSNNNLFRYTIHNNSNSYILDGSDYSTIADAFNRWDSLISIPLPFSHSIDVSFNIQDDLESTTLGYAGLNNKIGRAHV